MIYGHHDNYRCRVAPLLPGVEEFHPSPKGEAGAPCYSSQSKAIRIQGKKIEIGLLRKLPGGCAPSCEYPPKKKRKEREGGTGSPIPASPPARGDARGPHTVGKGLVGGSLGAGARREREAEEKRGSGW